jgi:sulfide:quinone oxidoreductase
MPKYIEPDFAVDGQISAGDVAKLAELGFKSIINNRPDDEIPFQPKSSDIETAAHESGLEFAHIPMSGNVSPDIISQTQEVLKTLSKPILAYCGSGTRSCAIWCFANVGDRGIDEVLDAARNAGYNLEQIRGMLENLKSAS